MIYLLLPINSQLSNLVSGNRVTFSGFFTLLPPPVNWISMATPKLVCKPISLILHAFTLNDKLSAIFTWSAGSA